MKLFRRLFGKEKKPRVIFIGIDGTPYSFLQRMMAEGRMPNLSQLVKEGDLKRNRSVYPTVSSVAWSSFMTGVNPGKHGIYGFIDRDPATMKPFIPTGRDIKATPLWEVLSAAGKRVLVFNVPVTYPPRAVNGILVSGFLAPTLDKATYPAGLSAELEALGYELDVDPWEGRKNKDKLLDSVSRALQGRENALFHYMDQENWDYAHCHVMETDRLHHFLWAEMEQGHPEFAPRFFAFYEQIDGFLGRVRDRLDEQTTLIIMSDHGFCRLRQEVYVNHWLAEQGWLRFKNTPPKGLPDVSPESVAYALDPGRIFVNADVAPDQKAYQRLRQEIMDAALALRDPESGHPIVAQAFGKEEIYQGPHLDRAADIILHPHDGFDLKGSLGKETLTYIGDELVGMHTYDDAALYISDQTMVVDDPWVADPMPTILKLLDVPLPHGLDGRLLVK